jgi:thioredoxin-like negative regulator of GroEL
MKSTGAWPFNFGSHGKSQDNLRIRTLPQRGRLATKYCLFIFGLFITLPLWLPADCLSPAFANSPVPAQSQPVFPSDVQAAQDLMGQKKWGDAAIILKSWLKENPVHSARFEAVMKLTRCYVQMGRREEALALLTSEPNGLDRNSVLGRRGIVLGRLFLTSASLQQFQEGVRLLEGGKFGTAKDRFERLLEVEPFNVEVIERLAQTLLMDGDPDSAIERMKNAKKLSPLDAQVRMWLGRALLLRGDGAEALPELQFADREYPRVEMIGLWIAQAYIRSNQRPLAISYLERRVLESPHHLQLLFELARTRIVHAPRDEVQLWSARKELQLILSRLDQPGAPRPTERTPELLLSLQETKIDLKREAESLLQQVDEKIEDEKLRKDSRRREGLTASGSASYD